ncbi:MAG: TadE/TadG family type IV pilus assembly protein [Planctomycetaceae bacterium]
MRRLRHRSDAYATGGGKNSRRCRVPQTRRGVETLEALIAFPVLIVATIGALEFALIMAVQQTVTSAAIAGVKVAAKLDGGDIDDVTDKVNEFLALHGVQATSGGDAVVQREAGLGDVSQTSPNPNDTGISFTPFGPALASLADNEIRVTVCVKFTNGDGKPVPDWLGVFGFSLGDRYFQASSLAQLE